MSSLLVKLLLLIPALCVGGVCCLRLNKLTRLLTIANAERPLRDISLRAIAKIETQQTVADVVKLDSDIGAFNLFLCGAFATAVGDVAMHPLDTIKIAQQTASKFESVLSAQCCFYAIIYLLHVLLQRSSHRIVANGVADIQGRWISGVLQRSCSVCSG